MEGKLVLLDEVTRLFEPRKKDKNNIEHKERTRCMVQKVDIYSGDCKEERDKIAQDVQSEVERQSPVLLFYAFERSSRHAELEVRWRFFEQLDHIVSYLGMLERESYIERRS